MRADNLRQPGETAPPKVQDGDKSQMSVGFKCGTPEMRRRSGGGCPPGCKGRNVGRGFECPRKQSVATQCERDPAKGG